MAMPLFRSHLHRIVTDQTKYQGLAFCIKRNIPPPCPPGMDKSCCRYYLREKAFQEKKEEREKLDAQRDLEAQ